MSEITFVHPHNDNVVYTNLGFMVTECDEEFDDCSCFAIVDLDEQAILDFHLIDMLEEAGIYLESADEIAENAIVVPSEDVELYKTILENNGFEEINPEDFFG